MASVTQTEPVVDWEVAPVVGLKQNLLWFTVGTLVSLFAVDAKWDIPLAAWIAPILLLRFSRTSGRLGAIGGVLAASTLQFATYSFEMGAPFSAVSVTFCLVLGAAFAIPYVLDRLLDERLSNVGRLFLMPVAAVLIEFGAASLLPVGASIGTRAITQSENLALMQIISVFGPYSIGFLIALAATVANHIWKNPTRETLLGYGGPFVAALLAILTFGQARLMYAGTITPAETVKIAGIVPRMALHEPAWAVSMDKYPASAQTRAELATPQMKALYAKLQDELLADTRAAAKSGAKVIFWSETAAPLVEADKDALLQKVSTLAREEGVYVNAAIGVPYERNETFLMGPDGKQIWHYQKNHPVPGMEPNAPFKNDVPVVDTPFGRLTNVICYDGDFPSLNRVPADIMLVPGMDTPDMAYVHTMRMTRLRTIENGYSMVRTDYNGVSAAFDRFGRVLGMLNTQAGKAYTMIVEVPTKGVPTLYSQTGDLFVWLCALAMLGLCAIGVVRPRAWAT
jgi:apolipoprotein N-acyltransferase